MTHDFEAALKTLKGWDASINWQKESGTPHVYVSSEQVCREHYDAIKAALELAMQSPWMPIESAIAGRLYIVYPNNGVQSTVAYYHQNGEWWDITRGNEEIYPTACMELPTRNIKEVK